MTFIRNRLPILAALTISTACSPAQKPVETPPPAAASKTKVVPPGEAKVGDRTTCPVNKEEFVVTEHSPKVIYEGKTYYFCCPGCDTTFQKDPKKYLGGS